MTEEQVQRLRDAGISDEVIVDMMKKDTDTKSEGYIDPTTPSSTFTQAQASGAPTQGPEQSWAQTGTEAAMLVPDALKYGAAIGIGAGAYKLGKNMLQPRPPAQPVAPVQPTTFTGGANPAFDKALSKPPAGPGIMQQGMDMAKKVQQVAMERVLQPAGQMASKMAPAARVGTGVLGAVMPGNMGQNYPFPMSGPMRGQEINPTTGRPWTPMELDAYRAQYGQ